MADLAIIVDTKSLVDAKNKLTAFQDQMGKTNSVLGLSRALGSVERNVEELIKAQAKGQLSSRSFQQGLLEQRKALEAMGMSSYMARQRVEQLAAALRNQQAARVAAQAADEAARATKRLADRQLELRMRFQEGYANFTRQREAMRSLREAYRSGILTLQQYEAQLARIRAANLGNVRGTNNLGVAMQQTGYQVGDFMVQIQGGANPMVAFGQQATQLVGVLYLMPPAMLAASISIMGLSISVGFLVMSLGIIIPIATAIGAYFMRMSGSSKTLSQRLDEVTSSSDKLKETFELLNDQELGLKFGNLTDEVRSLSSAMLTLDSNAQLKNFSAFLDKAERAASVNGFVGGVNQFFNEMINTPTFGLLGSSKAEMDEETFAELGYGIGRQQYLGYIDGLKSAANQGNREQIVRLFDNLISSLGSNVTPAGYLLADQMRKIALSVAEITAEMNGSIEADRVAAHLEEKRVESIQLYYDNLKKVSDLQQERKAGVQAILDGVDAETKSLQGQIDLNRKILQFGRDSAEVKAKEAEIAREQYRLQQMSEGILGNNLKTLMGTYDAYVMSAAQLEASEESSKGLADALKDAASAMSDLQNTGDLDAKLAGLVARLDAVRTGANEAAAGLVATETYKAQASLDAALTGGNDAIIRDAQIAYTAKLELINAVGVKTTALEDRKEANRESNKKGPTSETSQEALDKLVRQTESRRRLVDLTEEQARYEELLFKIQETSAGKRDPLSQKELEVAAKKIYLIEEQTRVIEEQNKVQEALASTIENSMENAFMSMVDGTKKAKDAFRDMAADIIKELYRVLVVKRMVSGITSFLGFADGGTFSGGSQIQAYANGGVVGGPTTFPMAGGKTGLMGEAGPEAIMPLKRGANGKLGVQMEGGGGDTIVVNQSFNFQANGDDSVKRIIAQAAPQIAQMTKKSMIDDRRRGGQMKATFG
jgi:hypothetical protein